MISVIIPVYKNEELFLKNLKNNLKFINDCEIIIVNDDPSTSLKNDLKDYKDIVLLENKMNLGFGQSINEGVKQTKCQYVMLLNSDVILKDQSFRLALKHFEKNPALFSVSFAQEEKDESTVGKNIIFWKNGFINHKKSASQTFGPNAWAEGGACIIDKNKFDRLHGFDPIYSPFYWEDIDLSYRALKKGHQILFDPVIKVQHQHESTIGKYFSKKEIKKITYRNQFLFTWKNITERKLIYEHILAIIPLLIRSLLKKEFTLIIGLINALFKIKVVLKKRALEKKESIKSDLQILNSYE